MANLLSRLFVFAHFPQVLHDVVFDDGVLFLGPPLCDGGQILLPEVFFEGLGVPFVGGEEGEQILDACALQCGREMVHRLICEVSAEDEGDNSDGHVCSSDELTGLVSRRKNTPFLTR